MIIVKKQIIEIIDDKNEVDHNCYQCLPHYDLWYLHITDTTRLYEEQIVDIVDQYRSFEDMDNIDPSNMYSEYICLFKDLNNAIQLENKPNIIPQKMNIPDRVKHSLYLYQLRKLTKIATTKLDSKRRNYLNTIELNWEVFCDVSGSNLDSTKSIVTFQPELVAGLNGHLIIEGDTFQMNTNRFALKGDKTRSAITTIYSKDMFTGEIKLKK